MILVRDIFQLKFGKAREALDLWKEGAPILNRSGVKVDRLLTDITGPYYTLVLESSHESMGAFENSMKSEVGAQDWQNFYKKFVTLVESGRREIFTIVKS
jgi:hypothetical protein